MGEGNIEERLPFKRVASRLSNKFRGLRSSKGLPVSSQADKVSEKGQSGTDSLRFKMPTLEESGQVLFEDIVEHVDLPDKEMAIEAVTISEHRAGILVEGWENVESTLTRYSGFGKDMEREQWEVDFFQKVLADAKASVERSGSFYKHFDRTETAFHKTGLEVKKLKGDGNKYILSIDEAYTGNAGEQEFANEIGAKTGLTGVTVGILLRPDNNRVFVNFDEARGKIIQALGPDGLEEDPDDRIVDKLKNGKGFDLQRRFLGGHTKDGIGLTISLENCIEENYSLIRQVGKVRIGDNRIEAPQDIDWDGSYFTYRPSMLKVIIRPQVEPIPSELSPIEAIRARDARFERLDTMAFDEDMQRKLLAAANKVKSVFEDAGAGTSQE